MRAMLAAINCQKGMIDENLATHERVIQEAAAAGCQIVVFPEMSLTGYVDPGNPDQQQLSLDSKPVLQLSEISAGLRIDILFGMAESTRDCSPFISQVFIEHGLISGVYRKRRLADNELSHFTPGTRSVVARSNGEQFGTAICADRDVPDEFEFASAAGAKVVFHPSAPGLDPPRRTDESSWRRGFDWWRSTCLEIHGERAKALGISIAVVTQAGATEDEDFPGWAAVIGPDGELKAELPDWQAGTLVIDL